VLVVSVNGPIVFSSAGTVQHCHCHCSVTKMRPPWGRFHCYVIIHQLRCTVNDTVTATAPSLKTEASAAMSLCCRVRARDPAGAREGARGRGRDASEGGPPFAQNQRLHEGVFCCVCVCFLCIVPNLSLPHLAAMLNLCRCWSWSSPLSLDCGAPRASMRSLKCCAS